MIQIRKRIYILTAGVIIISLFIILKYDLPLRSQLGNYINKVQGRTLDKDFKYKIKSGDLSTDYDIDTVLQDIKTLNFNTVNIPVAVDIKDLSSSDMVVDRQSEEKAIRLIKRLMWKKINIIIEPYPWIDNGSKYETDWDPVDKNTFFYNWQYHVLDKIIRDIAVPYHVNALIVASNLVHMESYTDNWESIIGYVGKYYAGLVTYKTSWWYTAGWDKKSQEDYEKKLNNPLFSKVDYISIAAYFELTDRPQNSVDQLVKALYKSEIYERGQNIEEQVENFYKKWNKPIFFGEIGFPNRDYASTFPWNPSPSNIINNSEQANCFEAYKKVFNGSWFLGFSVFAVGEHGKDKHFYPQAQSQAVIKNWFQ